MDKNRRKRRDFFQNITIVLLTLSAVFLIAQTQLYTLGVDAGSGYLRYLAGDVSQTADPSQAALTSLSAPVRLAVTGVYGGRYGSVSLTTTEESFEPVGGLLREALRSVRTFTPCERGSFLEALDGTSVYYDFLEPLPLSVLAGLVGVSLDSGVPARRLVISAQGGETVLYLWDGEDDCRRGTSAISAEELDSVVSGYELNGASFALDGGEPDAARMAPCSLFPLDLPELPVLSSAAALPDNDTLLTALGFYPRTNSRYTESGGVEVITDGDRTLRLSPDGSIRYRSGGDPALTIGAAGGEAPTVTEAVMGANALLNSLLAAQTSEAGLYLQSVRETENTMTLSFGWQAGGVPIRLDRGSAAAEVTLSGNVVSMLSFRFRQYTDTGETSLLLPLRQALAIAARQEGPELSIGYVDNGSTAAASWLAD